MRLSRGCYDKFHRCPGWAGGGPHYARVKRCEGGRLGDREYGPYRGRWWRLKFQRCNSCDVVVWPYLTRYLSPVQVWHDISWRVRNAVYLWRNR